MAWTTSLTTFRSCLVSLDDKEAWNLKVMQCMMGFYKQNMQTMQNVHNMQQNMQQNIPVAQFTNPSSQEQNLWTRQQEWSAACSILPFGCSICGACCNFSSSFTWSVSELWSNDMKRPNASRSFPKKSKKRLPGATGYLPSPGIFVRCLARHRLRTIPNPLMGEEVGIPVSGFQAGTGAGGDEFRRPTADLWDRLSICAVWSLSQVLVFCFGQLGPDSRADTWRVPRWLRSLSSNGNHLGTHRLVRPEIRAE